VPFLPARSVMLPEPAARRTMTTFAADAVRQQGALFRGGTFVVRSMTPKAKTILFRPLGPVAGKVPDHLHGTRGEQDLVGLGMGIVEKPGRVFGALAARGQVLVVA